MEFLKKILNKLSPGVKRGIGIFISPFSTMEMVEYDYDLGEVNNYSKMEFEYDSILREINIENFELSLQNIIKRFEVSSQLPVVLTLPSIFINKKVLPMDLQPDEIYTALISETEKNYIFKKSEPTVSWNVISSDKDNQTNTIIYSALQKHLIEKLEEIFKRQGLKLVSIETAYASFIKGLSVSGLVDDSIEKNLTWVVLIVKNNSNAVITLKGNQVLNIAETPLALNSLETDDLYPTLTSSLIEKIEAENVDSAVIINYSKVIETANLITYFDFKCPFIKIENNFCKGDPLFTYALDAKHEAINPEVIGASCWKNAPVRFGFNFSAKGQDDDPGFLTNLGIAGNPIHLLLLGLITLSTVLIALISLVAIPINSSLEEQYRQMFTKCAQYKEKFDKPQTQTFNLYDVVQTGFQNNEKVVAAYSAVSSVIPEKVWITAIDIDENMNASIRGRAYNVEDIVSYYENLLSVSKFNNFKIKSIKVVGENSGTDTTKPDVSINTVPNGPQMQPSPPPNNMSSGLPAPPGGSSMLPPPPSSSGINNTLAVSAGPRYYEFDFGNPTETQQTDPNQPQEQQKPGMPDLSGLSNSLKFGPKG